MENPAGNLATENESLRAEVADLRGELALVREQLAWFQRQVFGRKSERVTDLPVPAELLPGFELPAPEAPAAEAKPVAAHARRAPRREGQCALELPPDLERVERLVDVPEPERTLADGTPLVRIGEDRSEKLAYRPEEYYVLVTVRPKYALPGEPGLGVVQEPMPGSLVEGSKFDVSFMAHLVEEKYAFHMPLYRVEEKLAGRGVRVTRQTLAGLLGTCGERVEPLFRLMAERTLAQGCLFTDDTPVRLQDKGKCREARIWTYVGGLPNAPPYHIYQFTEDRSHRHPLEFLKGFAGTIHADAFGAYEKLHADPDRPVRWAACWAHARRKFEGAWDGGDGLCAWMLRHMRYLFLYERVAWARGPGERLRIRAEREAPIVAGIFRRLREALREPGLLPRSKTAEAIGYMLSREANFALYLADPDLRMDNNPAERSLRKVAVGRKNWLFIGSPKAGGSMAALLSLVQTCRAMDIRPWEYLADIFARLLDHPASRLEELLPDRWKADRDAQRQAAQGISA